MKRPYIFNLIFLITLLAIGYNFVPSAFTFGLFGKTPEGKAWYKKIKPFCNSVEVDKAIISSPLPNDNYGQAYATACYALAGKFERVKEKIDGSPRHQRRFVIDKVFNVALPFARTGDIKSAGPIMELVASYEPNHYLAHYYAGLSLYERRKFPEAQNHLNRFLKLFPKDSSMNTRAKEILQEIRKHS